MTTYDKFVIIADLCEPLTIKYKTELSILGLFASIS